MNSTYYYSESMSFSDLRCDKKLAVNGGNGCVYPAAPAVFVLSAVDGKVKEAAQHIREAQAAGSPGGLSIDSDGVAIANTGNALQRTRIAAANNSNRKASCGA